MTTMIHYWEEPTPTNTTIEEIPFEDLDLYDWLEVK